MSEAEAKVRLDKWLWAARFFKTRSLAKQAIEAGHVFYNGQRVKVSKDVQVGAKLSVRQGWDVKVVSVQAISDKRQSAPIAQTLYQETEDSIKAREQKAIERKQVKQSLLSPETKPDKRNRRKIQAFKQQNLGE